MKRILLSPGPVLLVWLGVVIGISFIEAPVKFTAPTLTRPVAFDVGRVVFTALNRTELVLFALTLVLGYVAERRRLFWIATVVLAAMLAAQTLWLLPELVARSEMVIAGSEPPPSIAHGAYAGIEVTKALLLAGLGVYALGGAADRGTRQP
ncbi:MAG TPA: hypothetical protein VJ883_04620 [Woeseiaceae bacterium]|nr:hypothetical protein [Woeseiaceae bacterium]